MEILIGSIVFLFLLLIIGTLLASKFKRKEVQEEKAEPAREIPSECCGAHEVCEFDELFTKSTEIVYFDDEELDRFQGKNSSDYSDEQIDEFRDILYTLHSKEINSWLKSIEIRSIQLPSILHPEARQLIADELKTKKAS